MSKEAPLNRVTWEKANTNMKAKAKANENRQTQRPCSIPLVYQQVNKPSMKYENLYILRLLAFCHMYWNSNQDEGGVLLNQVAHEKLKPTRQCLVWINNVRVKLRYSSLG